MHAHARTQTLTQTHTHTRKHTHTQTHTHTHTHTLKKEYEIVRKQMTRGHNTLILFYKNVSFSGSLANEIERAISKVTTMFLIFKPFQA